MELKPLTSEQKEKRKLYNETYRREHKAELAAYRKSYRLETIASYCLGAARARARKRDLDFTLDKTWCEERWTGRCELSGILFDLVATSPSPYSPSLDRIDNDKGYTQNNCRFILYGLNSLKGIGNDVDMYKIAEALVRNMK